VPFFLICFALTTICLIGDYCAKTQKPVMAFGFWAFNSAMWSWLYYKQNLPLATTGALYSVLYYVGTLGMGVLLFGEPVSNLGKVGMILGMVAIASGK
jgi:drug/metabolite transporter (DMT)-like permease